MSSNEYVDVQKERKSLVWGYYLLNKADEKAKCNICLSLLKTTGSTKNLIDHLKNKHKIVLKKSLMMKIKKVKTVNLKLVEYLLFLRKRKHWVRLLSNWWLLMA